MPANQSFFEESLEQSGVKSAIVTKYFWAWAKVMKSAVGMTPGVVAYIDLFSGPGRYKDGTKSTPLLLLEKAVQDTDLTQRLVVEFSDKDPANCASLENEISQIPGIERMKHKPQVLCREVDASLAAKVQQYRLVPTLLFVDPWGYKGLSLDLISSYVKDWGCDCIFFFNYNRINAALGNEKVRAHVDALFGAAKAKQLRMRLTAMEPDQRESEIIQALENAIQTTIAQFTLSFCFKNATGNRTSHHLIFASKDFLGYEIMKEIMAAESSRTAAGVPSFTYWSGKYFQTNMFDFVTPIDILDGDLMTRFAGKNLTVYDVYRQHNVGTPYIKRHYKQALLRLEDKGKVVVTPSVPPRRKGTMGDRNLVSFSGGGE